MDFFILILVGLGMGVMGGLLGIGGSLVMIPALTLIYGENQHLYQAAAMICIFFVSSASMIAHHKARAISKNTLLRMIPAAMVGIIAGVALSNSPLFRGTNDYILARVFGGFLVYVAGYNSFRMYQSVVNKASLKADTTEAINTSKTSWPIAAGLLTGIGSGLLGIGAGTIATPLQQLLLKHPIKRAMSNSAVVIVCISWLGAISVSYTHLTLPTN